MIYEFIATVTAGFGMAGLALIIRHLLKLITGKTSPKWLIPVFAGIGMLGFQVHQEYHWQDQQMNLLSEDVKIVKIIEEKVWYRPWSHIKPQIIRFMAVNQGTKISSDQLGDKFDLSIGTTKDDLTQVIQPNDQIKKVNLYLFERRISTKIVPQLINCTRFTTANLTGDLTKNGIDSKTKLFWHKLDKQDPLIKAVCQ